MLQDRLGLHHGLDQLVVDSGLDRCNDDLWLGDHLLDDLGSLIAAQEKLTASLVNGFLGLGRLNKSLNVVSLGNLLLLGLSGSFKILALLSKLLDNLLAFLADSDASVWILQESNELVTLLKVGMVGLESHVEGDARGKSDHETDESNSALQILVELLLGEVAVRQAREEGRDAALLDLLPSLLLLFEFSGLLRKHSHCDVMGAAKSLLRWDVERVIARHG